MQQRWSLSAFVLVGLLLAIGGYACTAMREGTGKIRNDAVITTKVIAAIFKEPALKVGAINVDSFNGAVKLRGSAMSPADMIKAVEVARRVSGVTSVRNDMWLMTCS